MTSHTKSGTGISDLMYFAFQRPCIKTWHWHTLTNSIVLEKQTVVGMRAIDCREVF